MSFNKIMPEQNRQLNKENLAYLYQKTERLVSAIYLLSNFLSDSEPLKWQWRTVGLSLLNPSQSLTDKISVIKQLLSLLTIAHIGGLISEMNHRIVSYEFDTLLQAIRPEEKENNPQTFILSENFFKGTENPPALPPEVSKGHNILSDRLSLLKQKDKSNRQNLIVGLLKKGNELGIKDFTSAIKDGSEKTIQRELAVLVSKGLVRKEGEKRWSRYVLK